METSGEKSSRKSGSNNYAARLLPSAHRNNLIWVFPGKPSGRDRTYFGEGCDAFGTNPI